MRPVAALVPLVLATLLLGCASAQQGNAVTYHCDGGKTLSVVYGASSARVTLPDGTAADWRQLPSASGVRYGDGTTSLWSKGREAFVERGGQTILGGCREVE
ncbi:MAG TPA: MliC family protein [Myxococcota bacterium]|jgi:membrane-bound inhibitor of C-type lysozyme|nr:MliC family protein [Myxococcota bacterium]